jgi:hypothetical protein
MRNDCIVVADHHLTPDLLYEHLLVQAELFDEKNMIEVISGPFIG